ncbi:MAG: peptidylprolyl isomerase [Calditrichia bacterium]
MKKTTLIILLLSGIAGLVFANGNDLVIIETDSGRIVVELFSEKAPVHSKNFKKLADQGFYNGTSFHRIAPQFVIQGGDPLSKDDDPSNDGSGGTGYLLPAEIGEKHLRGRLGAARMGDAVNPARKSNGSQFYICLEDLPQLDALGYTIFGQVVEGMDVVGKIARMPVRGQTPLIPVRMRRVFVQRAEKKP